MLKTKRIVTLAEAGVQSRRWRDQKSWIPAFAGMTSLLMKSVFGKRRFDRAVEDCSQKSLATSLFPREEIFSSWKRGFGSEAAPQSLIPHEMQEYRS
jgi:hypothetical protein